MVGAAGIPETSTAVANNGNGKEKKISGNNNKGMTINRMHVTSHNVLSFKK